MKKILSPFLFLSVFAAVLFSSCADERTTPPTIIFKTGSVYVSKDTTMYRLSLFNIGVDAGKTGTDGLLNGCIIQRSHNGGADSTLQEMSFVMQHFSQFYSYSAPDSGNTDKYTFTITERDGGSNSVSVSITGN